MYLYESGIYIQETSLGCQNWAFKYDGTKPNSLLNMNVTEELLSTRQPFIRLSSARSSFASTGWNRYFQNRSAHGTQDKLASDLALTPNSEAIPPLNTLGEDEHISINKCGSDEKFDSLLDSGQEDFSDFNSQYGLISDSQDYFQFAYEGISESDESTSRRNSYKDEEEENVKEIMEPQKPIFSSKFTAATQDEFLNLLDTLPEADRAFEKATVDQSVALIESRFQYFQELKEEKEKVEYEGFENNVFKLDLKNEIPTQLSNGFCKTGLLITCTDEKGPGILLESLLQALDKIVDRGFSTNIQLMAVFNSLLSYSQPVITSYLLYIDAIKSNALYAYASSTDGFEEMLQRGLRHKISRAERYEKTKYENSYDVRRGADRNLTARSTLGTASSFRFTHKAMESRDHLDDISRSKNYAYAAIILSQLCQICAAYALQHRCHVSYSK